MNTNTLTKGETYDITTIDFTGWTEGDGTGHEGYNVADYFRDGTYLGADEHGIEPTVSFNCGFAQPNCRYFKVELNTRK